MKRLLFTLLLAVALTGFIAAPASAHILKTDGYISAVLHTTPDDNPVSGTPSSLALFFSDRTNKFSLTNCICNLTILENGQTVDYQSLAAQQPGYSQNPFTFPNPDVYTIKVSGNPKVAKDFQPFELDYIVRVEPGGSTTNEADKPFSLWIWIGLWGMIGAVLLAAVYQDRSRPKRKD